MLFMKKLVFTYFFIFAAAISFVSLIEYVAGIEYVIMNVCEDDYLSKDANFLYDVSEEENETNQFSFVYYQQGHSKYFNPFRLSAKEIYLPAIDPLREVVGQPPEFFC
jgi:hypothetical protein